MAHTDTFSSITIASVAVYSVLVQNIEYSMKNYNQYLDKLIDEGKGNKEEAQISLSELSSHGSTPV